MLAAKAATSNIPIVFVVGTDPIKLGVVASFNKPGGNATGVDILTTSLDAKRLKVMRDCHAGIRTQTLHATNYDAAPLSKLRLANGLSAHLERQAWL